MAALGSNPVAVSLLVSGVVMLAAGFLAVRLWLDRRRREPDLDADDARHYARQDVRRALGAAIMVLLAVGISVGTRVPYEVAGRSNRLFVQIWLVICLLLLALLVLALIDWIATRFYARRHRRRLVRDSLQLLRDEAARRSFPTNGQPRRVPPAPGNTPPTT